MLLVYRFYKVCFLVTMCVSLYTAKLKYAGVWGTKQKPYPFREVESLEQPLMQTMKVSISFIMYTEKSMLDSVHEGPGLLWLHTHAGRKKHEKKEFRAINWDLRSNLFSPRKKKKRDADGSPFFPRTQSVHSVFPRRGKATFVSCASALATVQKCSFVELGSRSVQGGVRNLRPQLLLSITSPVDYPRSTIQSLKIVTREMTQPLISSLMCRFTDRHAAVIAPTRNLSFSPLRTPRCALRRKGDRQSLSSHPYPTTHRGIKEPSPPLRTLCLKRRFQRYTPWVVGREGEKKGYLLTEPWRAVNVTSRTRDRARIH